MLAATVLSCAGSSASLPSSSASAGRGLGGARSEQRESGVVERRAAPVFGPNARYVVELGAMRNDSGVRGDELGQVLHDAARVRARAMDGAVVIEREGPLAREAADRHLPVITLDGLVTRITESRPAGGVQVLARVEFAIRREQILEATFSGAAMSFGTGPTLSEDGRRRLQEQAIDGAVQSALGGAARGLLSATRPSRP